MPRRRRPAAARSALVVRWFGWWVLSMALWLLFTSTVNASEAIAGVGASCVVATLAELARRRAGFACRLKAAWVLLAWRIPLAIVTDTVLVLHALASHVTGRRRVRGTVHALPFRHGGPSASSAARRALATAGITMTPNTFVIGIDDERDEILVHQLVSRPGSVAKLLGRP
jgi:multisubunit Na+/H+ antiporter MnhE subunit